MENEKVKFEFVPTNVYTRWQCHLCGGHTEKVSVLTEVTEGPEKGLRICEFCLEAGPAEVEQKMTDYATRFQEEAVYVRGLIGRLVLPSYEEWQAALKRHEDEVMHIRFGRENDTPWS